MPNRILKGRSAEEAAAGFLKKKGYRIIQKNYRTKLGEIDIIAKDKDTFCFIEVKSRHSDKFGSPKESITADKQNRIAKSSLIFLKANKLFDEKSRFDVVALSYPEGKPKIELIKDAFDLGSHFIY
ncbi:MAG: YraN family protein [Candidatus Omnitrophica bacterium]|nr:YraN family protein [Candidatus Omnitrophota bacterium]